MLTKEAGADIVVILKTLPTREAVEALKNKVQEELQRQDMKDIVKLAVNDDGFDVCRFVVGF